MGSDRSDAWSTANRFGVVDANRGGRQRADAVRRLLVASPSQRWLPLRRDLHRHVADSDALEPFACRVLCGRIVSRRGVAASFPAHCASLLSPSSLACPFFPLFFPLVFRSSVVCAAPLPLPLPPSRLLSVSSSLLSRLVALLFSSAPVRPSVCLSVCLPAQRKERKEKQKNKRKQIQQKRRSDERCACPSPTLPPHAQCCGLQCQRGRHSDAKSELHGGESGGGRTTRSLRLPSDARRADQRAHSGFWLLPSLIARLHASLREVCSASGMAARARPSPCRLLAVDCPCCRADRCDQ